MKESQCARLGKKLLRGETVSKAWSMENKIGSLHSRMIRLGEWTRENITEFPRTEKHWYWPVNNLGSDTGLNTVAYNGRKTNQAVFYLPAKYRPALRKALQKRGLL